MMRILLLIFGWESMIGSVGEAAICAHAIWLAANGLAPWDMSVADHIRGHLALFVPLIDLAHALFPHAIVDWFLAWPTLGFYPLRIAASLVLGTWALRAARRMGQARAAAAS